ncbi:MAG: DAK2 domain-containing protein [Clostridia bacterium]|nr:DAK2 domain-containing protein [Clostridia bacterium]
MCYNKINGEDYRVLILNAAKCLEDNENEINELNVFPVPDGDTGSNMSKTVGNAARELLDNDSCDLNEVADKTARAMLHGARGNSGVIVSLLFRGIAKGLKGSFECDGRAWAEALKQGVDSAYGAIENPAEGTILTVARKCAEAATEASKEQNSFEYVLEVAIDAAEKALEETISQNPVLEKAGVVDAGGMGWLLVMKAMLSALKGDMKVSYTPKKETEGSQPKANFSAFATDDIKFSFCTEFIITKNDQNVNSAPLKKYLSNMGDSLVMLDDGEIIKVHIHTNEPHAVLGEALKWGIYENVKVENMRTQHTSKIIESKAPLKDYGFVTVASGDGICQLFSELGADKIVSGGQTMNPSTEDIFRAVEEINAKTVFILPNNKNIILTAEQVKSLAKCDVIVIPTKSIPQGISAMLSFNEAFSPKENTESMIDSLGSVTTMQITYAVRSTTFDGVEIEAGDYLGLLESKMLLSAKSIDEVIKAFAEKLKGQGKESISIYYGCDVTEDQAQSLIKSLEALLPNASIELYKGDQPVYYYIISAE